MVKKKGKASLNKKGEKQGAKATAWSSFTFVTVCTIIIFWVLFPFYSYQLQIIFDQKGCFTDNKEGEKKGECRIPFNENDLPYKPPNQSDEKETGNTMITQIGTVLKQLYKIITGMVWIEIDKNITKAELSMHTPKVLKQKSNVKGSKKSSASVPNDSVETVIGSMSKFMDVLAEDQDLSMGGGGRMGIGSNGEEPSPDAIAKEILKNKLHFNSRNFENMACCEAGGDENMYKYYDEDTGKKCKEAQKAGFLSKPPLNFLNHTTFGWPYTYLFNENDEKPTQYDPNGDEKQKSMIRWIGGWFGKTQQKSWSTMRGWWVRILMLFLPFLEEEDVSKEDINTALQTFISALGNSSTSAVDDDDEEKNGDKLSEIVDKFIDIKKKFDKPFKTTPRANLLSIISDVALTEGNPENNEIYLQFFTTAVRKAKYDGGRWFSSSVGLGGDKSYWMRYIITWYIPILTMIIMSITMFLGFWLTAFSTINPYSSIILPFFFGIWVSFYNMFMLPTSLFWYFIMGGMGQRPASQNCPYDSGVYQMRRNFWQYLPLNLYLTLGIISMQLGSTFTLTGKPKLGVGLTFAFPGLIILVLIYRLFSALYNML